MFSKRFYTLVSLMSLFLRFFGASPLLFDRKLLIMKIDSTVHTKMQINYNLFIFWAVAAFYTVIKFRREGDLDRCILTFAYWINGFVITLAYSFLRWFYHDCCIIMNGLFILMRYIHRNFLPNFDPDSSKFNMAVDIFLSIYAFSLCGVFILMLLILLYDPTGMVFLGVLVPPKYFTLPVRGLVILYHTYLLIVGLVCVCALCAAIVIYACYVTPFYLRELRMGRPRYNTINYLRKPENIRHMYTSLQILHANAMQLCGIFLVFSNGHFMFTCLYCNAVLINYWKVLMPMSKAQFLIMGVMITGFWTFILEMGRYFFAKGGKVLGSWKGGKWGSQHENKIMKKFHRSCKPILLAYGSQFIIRRANVLMFLRGVVRGTFRTLLLIKKK